MTEPYTIETWTGEFGDEYLERNPLDESAITGSALAFARILSSIPPVESVLEVGANVGIRANAIRRISTAEVHVLEPNAQARRALRTEFPESQVHSGHAGDLPFADSSFDLVFTAGVLIHVPDDGLRTALRELYRCARRYILCLEYFSQEAQEVPYRGQRGLLWKRDYGSLWMDAFPDLQLVDYGFLWRRVTPFDDTNWWLFAK